MKRRTTKKPRPATARITRRRSLSRAPKMVASHQSSPSSPPPGGPRRSRRAAGLFGNVPGRYSTSANEFGRFGGDFGDFGGDAREGTRDAALPGGGGRLGGGDVAADADAAWPGVRNAAASAGVRNALGGPGSVSVSLARGVAAWWTPGRFGPEASTASRVVAPGVGGREGVPPKPGGAASARPAAGGRRRGLRGGARPGRFPRGPGVPRRRRGVLARRRARREPRLRRRATRARGRGRFLQHHRRALSLREEPRSPPRGNRRRGPARRPAIARRRLARRANVHLGRVHRRDPDAAREELCGGRARDAAARATDAPECRPQRFPRRFDPPERRLRVVALRANTRRRQWGILPRRNKIITVKGNKLFETRTVI